jgi:Tol biopolymer transport system component
MEDPLTDRIVVPAAFLLASAVISVGCSPDLEPISDRVEKPEEIVVYSTVRPANWDLYLFEQPGAAPKLLTTDPSPDYNPAFSPDGRWVVFTSDRHGTADLLALDLNNPGAPIRLTSSLAMEDAAAFSPDGQSLAFVSTESGHADIHVMAFAPDDPEAAVRATNLTRDEAGDFNPAFSPDGEWIAFSSNRDSPDDLFWSAGAPDDYRAGDVYVMRVDGTDVRRLTEYPGWDGSPAWASDGSLVFYSQREGAVADRDAISESIGSGGLITRIYRMNSDGSELRAVSASGENALSPAVAAEGRVAFSAQRGEGWTIVSTEADGTNLRVESDAGSDYWAPAYDPNSGRMIAFGPGESDPTTRFETDAPGPFLANPPHSVELPDRTLRLHAVRGYLPTLDPTASEVATSEGFSRLMISRLDGADKRIVFDSAQQDRYRGDLGVFGPTWSDDGAWLAYGVGLPFSPVADVDIWKSRTDGSEAVNLTPDSDANDALPDFSPDGRRIVFRSTRDGNKEIYLMNADGTGLRRLTETEATNTMPSFCSAGDRIAFVSTRDGDYEIYILDLGEDGSPGEVRRVTNSPGRDMHPKFSPDDKWLLFASQRAGVSDEVPLLRVIFQPQPYGEAYAMRLEDGEVFRLTQNKWEDGPAAWGRTPGE